MFYAMATRPRACACIFHKTLGLSVACGAKFVILSLFFTNLYVEYRIATINPIYPVYMQLLGYAHGITVIIPSDISPDMFGTISCR